MPMDPRLMRPKRRAAGDPYWANVELLMNFDGPSFMDSSPDDLAITTNGSPAISTAQSKFGGASGLFGRDDYLTGPAQSEALDFSATPGTVECWLFLTEAVGTNNVLFLVGPEGRSGTTGLALGLVGRDGDNTYAFVSYTTTGPTLSESSPITLNAWHHIAWVIDGSALRIYLDGARIEQVTLTGSQEGSGVVIGNDSPGMPILPSAYYLDELRITKGVARYAGASYTLPAAAFPNG